MFYTRLSVHRGRGAPWIETPRTETPRQRPPLERDPQTDTSPGQRPPDRDPRRTETPRQRTVPGTEPPGIDTYWRSLKRAVRILLQGRIQDSPRRGRQHTNLPGFPKKLHEIKKMLVHSGVRAGGAPPLLDPALYWNAYLLILISLL